MSRASLSECFGMYALVDEETVLTCNLCGGETRLHRKHVEWHDELRGF